MSRLLPFDKAMEALESHNNIDTLLGQVENGGTEEYPQIASIMNIADSVYFSGTRSEIPFQFSFDACMRLKHVRRKTEKKDKVKVDDNEKYAICTPIYTNQIPRPSNQTNHKSTCSNFLANSEYPDKKESKRFDRRAVAGAVCARHGIPVPGTFSNVYCGEA